ncbi:MAG: hypothetical protein HYU97_10055 [Deltaproteobacteria bacterium]|nr:hypothetical protein [Deltaproteobacteria bacterium]
MKKMIFVLVSFLIVVPFYSLQAGGEQPTHVITMDTHYYKDGPQQARPPDGTFKKGEKVTLIRSSGSYALVKSAGGIEAYVASASLSSLETIK